MNTRAPANAPVVRMDSLARLPVFYDLRDARVLVAGGTAAAAWKAELLHAAGAEVHVYSERAGEEMLALVAEMPRVVLHARRPVASDFTGMAMAVGDPESLAEEFVALARAASVPVNVIDKPEFCDFTFGSIVNRSPLVIGISTDGAAPVFGQAVRARLEALIPAGFAHWAKAARDWRPRLQALALPFRERRTFWERFTDCATTGPRRVPGDTDFDALVVETRGIAAAKAGSVILVGAGPGDTELLTLRAVRELQSADVILFDDLVSPQVLDFARREARKMLVGKTGHGPSCKQSEINELMIKLAREGKRVARLKGGDPMIFGRAGEEIEACRAAGIPVEVVAGVTAAQGAAASLGVSLTRRTQANRVQYVTGHDRGGALPSDIDWQALADPHATTVVYMPRKTLAVLSERAIREGADPAMPALAVVNATRTNETVITGTIATLAAALGTEQAEGPVLVMIGRVLEAYARHREAHGALSAAASA